MKNVVISLICFVLICIVAFLFFNFLQLKSQFVLREINSAELFPPRSSLPKSNIFRDKLNGICKELQTNPDTAVYTITIDQIPFVDLKQLSMKMTDQPSIACGDEHISAPLENKRILEIYNQFSRIKPPHVYSSDGDAAVLLKNAHDTIVIMYLTSSGDGGFYSTYLLLEGRKTFTLSNGERVYATISQMMDKVASDEDPLKKGEHTKQVLAKKLTNPIFSINLSSTVNEVAQLLDSISLKAQ